MAHESYNFEGELVDINYMRQKNGMTKIKPKERNCLKCDKKFVSHSMSNRLCVNCRVNNSTKEDMFLE
jgi:hypothetical protein